MNYTLLERLFSRRTRKAMSVTAGCPWIFVLHLLTKKTSEDNECALGADAFLSPNQQCQSTDDGNRHKKLIRM